MGVDAGGNPQIDSRRLPRLPRQLRESVQFAQVIHHNPAHAVFQRHTQFGDGFVVPMKIQPLRGEADLHGRIKLATGHHIRAAALVHHDAVQFLKAAGFAGKSHHAPIFIVLIQGGLIAAQGAADGGFVHHIQGGAILRGQFDRIAAANGQMTRGVHR